MSLFDKTSQALQTSLAMRQLRHNVTSSNVANAETPGYHAQKVDFEDALARAVDLDGLRGMSANHGDHFSVGGKSARVRPDIYDNPQAEVNPDGNTVDLEKEMSTLAENAILYKAALQLINKKMAALKYAASEGR
ncbi:MAG: flagellar basal body rod protein FlgB [Bdellovibrionaceae bacterium]|nr:flagellar basal body rod protein FlgB [Pseudobdellovibrionaceae bacterium]MBX3033050.1 flagellar basal body rod protein FlgB [Pseudobdellovibrionaceae bacterium]